VALRLRRDNQGFDTPSRNTRLKEDSRNLLCNEAFSYYGRAFGLETVGLAGISTDVDPSVRRVQVLAQRIVAEQIPAVFLETSVPARGVKALIVAAESQGHTVSIKGPLYTDSLGEAGTEAGSWEGMIMANTIEITCALGAVTLEDCP